MAPVAGRHFAAIDAGADTAVVADAGGTSYDVSLVRRGEIPWTRETWLGQPYLSHMTGFPSVDVRSIGAGGGSVAWVDAGGLLHVGPESAGAVPGPVCYGLGGTSATVTDASVVLGYIDPGYFLGGRMPLNIDAASAAIEKQVAEPLRLSIPDAAAAVLRLVTEQMARAIEEITLNQGVDPRSAIIVAGGGAAGLNAAAIAKRLEVTEVVIPDVAAALSAAGALMSDLTTDFAGTLLTSTSKFDFEGVNRLLASLQSRCEQFISGPGFRAFESSIEYSVEARYPHQIWELEVPLRNPRFESNRDFEALRLDFHAKHMEVFAISDPQSPVECVTWRARARCRLRRLYDRAAEASPERAVTSKQRRVYFPGHGFEEARVAHFDSMPESVRVEGPAIIESAVTTVVLEPGALAQRCPSGSLLVNPPGVANTNRLQNIDLEESQCR
jgi:N-methylhydantoinase A